MNNRAEEAALKAYPIKTINSESTLGRKYDGNMIPRYYFINGYEQAEKDILNDLPRWRKAALYFDNYTIVPDETGEYCLLIDGYCISLSDLKTLPKIE